MGLPRRRKARLAGQLSFRYCCWELSKEEFTHADA
jgi:hypothetical protein